MNQSSSFSHGRYAASCQHIICKRYIPTSIDDIMLGRPNSTDKMKNGDRVYAITNETPPRVWQIIAQKCRNQKIKLTFVFLDEPRPNLIALQIVSPHAINIFLVNAPFIDLPKNVHVLPLAFADRSTITNFTPTAFDKKDSLCLLRFMTRNNYRERGAVENELGHKSFVTNLNNKQIIDDAETKTFLGGNDVSVETFYKIMNRFKYVLDPAGCGVATHRFWESIYFNAIPIVRRTHTAMDKLCNFYPCLIVNRWSDVTQQLLLDNLETQQQRITKFKSDYPTFFEDISVSFEISENHL